jgi:hypothetical protein
MSIDGARCRGPVDRRTFLKVGGLSMGALAGAAQPGLSRLLAAQSGAGKPDREFSVILLWAAGGPSHLDTFDMKPEAPEEYRGPFKPIHTNVPGIDICELLPNLARRADKFSLIRSLHHNRNEHSGGTSRLLSGYASVSANPADGEFPEIGSVLAKQLEDRVEDLPLYVASNKFYGGGPAYLGPAYSPFMYDGDPNDAKFSAGSLTVSNDAVALLKTRVELLKSFDSFRREVDRSQSMSAVDKFNQQALDMLTSSRTRLAFDLSKEPDTLRDKYGRTTGGQSLLLARRLVEAGVRFVQVTANFPVSKASGRIGNTNWDDHSVNSDIFKAYQDRMPVFDVAVPALIDDLYARGLDRDVLFIFCGEFGRTPKIGHQDATKRPGRDHWCRAMSILVSGGGLKMGQAIGATNARAEEPTDRVMNSNCLLATIYHRFGIDTTQLNHDNTGRPIPILTDGKPIPELI